MTIKILVCKYLNIYEFEQYRRYMCEIKTTFINIKVDSNIKMYKTSSTGSSRYARKMSYIFRLKYEKIKETFEANPNRDFNITELKEITSISSNTISKYIELLLKNNLIEEVSFACSSRYRYPRSKYIFNGCKNAIEVGGIY